MKAGIIGAMEQEVAILKAKIDHCQQTQVANYTFYHGMIDQVDVILVQSGIGKVAAALATALLIERFAPDFVVNTGSAGGFDPSLNVGDIVISNNVSYNDVNVTAFGYDYGQLPGGFPTAFTADEKLVSAAETAVGQLTNIQAKVGLITTGDTFMTADEDIAKARTHFPTMAAVEMEGAAIAQTCYQFNQTPFVIIRSLSDIAGKESPESFEAYLETASINSSQLVLDMLSQLQKN